MKSKQWVQPFLSGSHKLLLFLAVWQMLVFGQWPSPHSASLFPQTQETSVIPGGEITEQAPGEIMAYPKLCIQLTVDLGLDWIQHKASASQRKPAFPDTMFAEERRS